MHPPIPFEDIVGESATEVMVSTLTQAYGPVAKDEDGERQQLSFLSSGLYLLVDKETDRVISCTLFSRPGSRWAGEPFRWSLPGGLVFGMSRDEARSVAGSPVDSNDRFRWDRWDFGSFLVRAGYTTEGRLVTVDLLAG